MRLEAFLYLAAQNFELFSKIQDKKKPVAVDALFEAHSMIRLSCTSNLAGRCL